MQKIWKIFWGVIFLAVCSGCGIKKEQKKTIEDTKEKIYRECEMLAEDYQSIYENAAKENALYELSTIQKSMDYFGKYGYAVIDSYNQLDMVQSIKVDDFLKKAEKEKNGKTTIFQVIAGDHFIRYDLKTKQGKIDVEVSSFKWKEDTWQETYYHEFRANSWKYTENGYFFMEEYHPAGYDGPSGYRAFRVVPLNKKCRELNRKYILPFGYTLNKLFTSNWSEKNYDGINFYDVFDRLLSMEEKTDEFKEGKTYEIPKESFETIFQKYFNISAEILQTGTVFHTETQTYRYRTRGIVYDFAPTPYIPYPEVVSYIENQDGTITLEVNAVWPQKELDQAFCHSVTIRLLDKDRFQYVSNYVSRSEIEVTWYTERLSDEKWEECYGDN